jgi:hypothetical protein
MASSYLEFTFCQAEDSDAVFFAILHVEDRCGGNCSADCRYFRQDGTAVVTISVV